MNVPGTNPELKISSSFAFSQSSLQDYSDCPRRFYLRYIQHMPWPAVESGPEAEFERRQSEGRAFHRLAQQYLLGLPLEKLEALAVAANVGTWWHNFVSAQFDLRGHTTMTELAISAGVGGHRLVAKYDLLVVDTGTATIYDWKTSTRRPPDEWLAARWQSRVYPALLAMAGSALNNNTPLEPTNIQMVYWFAEFPLERAAFKYDLPQLKRDWEAIETVVREIASASDFPMTQDPRMCRFCIFRSYCGRGEKAGSLEDSEMIADVGEEPEGSPEDIRELRD